MDYFIKRRIAIEISIILREYSEATIAARFGTIEDLFEIYDKKFTVEELELFLAILKTMKLV